MDKQPQKQNGPDPDYPTLEEFDRSPRRHLGKAGMVILGVAVVGGGLLATALFSRTAGEPMPPPARTDVKVLPLGGPRVPPARIDSEQSLPDAGPIPDLTEVKKK